VRAMPAAQHHDRQHSAGFMKVKDSGDETLDEWQERAAKRRTSRPSKKRRQLGRGGLIRARGQATSSRVAIPGEAPIGRRRSRIVTPGGQRASARIRRTGTRCDGRGSAELDCRAGGEPPRRRQRKPNMVGRGDAADAVRPPRQLCPLIMTRRMISPNASVTSASSSRAAAAPKAEQPPQNAARITARGRKTQNRTAAKMGAQQRVGIGTDR